jgi:glutamate:Na+ symporter, ESS family
MDYWSGAVATIVVLMVLLAVAEVVLHALRGRLPLPASIIAGVLALLCGPDLLQLVPLDRKVLETLVYHGLAVVFIAVSLQTPRGGPRGQGAVSMAYGITVIIALQTLVGLLVALGLGLTRGVPVHPGFGLLLSLGFEQGPGQALSMGAAWEKTGLADGAQVGLIIASVGFAWSIVVGIPLLRWGQRRGLLQLGEQGPEAADAPALSGPSMAGGLDGLVRQLAAIGVVYAMTYATCSVLYWVFSSRPGIAAMAWGFHFIFGALIAQVAGGLLRRFGPSGVLDDGLLSRVAGTAVDVTTVSALGAIQVAVLGAYWMEIALLTTIGGLVTLVVVVWLARRAFRIAPFEHCLVWFGLSTGTLPMGLALLRVVDPDLRSPAPVSAVMGSAGAVVGAIPSLLLLHPMALEAWPANYPVGGWVVVGAAALYLAVVLALWARFGGLRAGLTPWRLWPEGEG